MIRVCALLATLVLFASFGLGTVRAQAGSAAPTERSSQRYMHLMLDGHFARSGTSGTGSGGGAALRFGAALPVRSLVLVPEVGGDFVALAGPRETTLYGGFGGMRVRLAGLVEPGAFAHVGAMAVQREGRTYAAPTLDVGVSILVTFRERLLTGLQGQYKSALGTGRNTNFNWYTFGIMVGTKL